MRIIRKLLIILSLIFISSCSKSKWVDVTLEMELITGRMITQTYTIKSTGELYLYSYRGGYSLKCIGCYDKLMRHQTVQSGAIWFKEISRVKSTKK